MNDVIKGMIVILMVIYVLSPIDLCPGPVDDLIVVLIGLAARKGIEVAGNKEV